MTRFLPFAVLAAAAAACSADRTPDAPDPTEAVTPAPAPIAVERPEFIGVISARRSKVIAADFDARIDRLMLSTGQRVHAGDLIGRLDDRDLKLQLDKAKASERAARSAMGAEGARAGALAHAAHSQEMLARSGVSSRATLIQAKADYASAGATTGAAAGRLEEAQVARKQIEEMLTKAEIKAPIDGVITAVKAREGEVAQKGTQLAKVSDPSDLIVKFAVPHEDRPSVRPGARVALTIEGVDRIIYATIVGPIGDEVEPPVNFTLVEADIDDSKLTIPDEVRVSANARVRIADATTGAKR